MANQQQLEVLKQEPTGTWREMSIFWSFVFRQMLLQFPKASCIGGALLSMKTGSAEREKKDRERTSLCLLACPAQ